MGCSKKGENKSFWPDSGPLKRNLDKNRTVLKELKLENSRVDAYVLSSIESENGGFIQTGCGPNWDGGLLSQCTCRPDLRARKKVEDWKDTWIAGFTSSKLGGHYLFYLMKIEYPLESFKKLYEHYDEKTREAKSMSINPRGDLYVPLDSLIDEWSKDSYELPCKDHSHHKDKSRNKDIEKQYYGRHPSLLVGYKDYSYIWARPLIKKKTPFGTAARSGKIYKTLEEFLDDLVEVYTV